MEKTHIEVLVAMNKEMKELNLNIMLANNLSKGNECHYSWKTQPKYKHMECQRHVFLLIKVHPVEIERDKFFPKDAKGEHIELYRLKSDLLKVMTKEKWMWRSKFWRYYKFTRFSQANEFQRVDRPKSRKTTAN